MSRKNSTRIVVLVATLGVSLAAANAQQNQTANQPQNQQQVQQQPVQQNQPVQQQQQPQQKKNFWQKVRDYSQSGQNVMQQGQNTVQQGTGGVQQGVQNGVQQIQNVAQPGMGGGQAGANGFQGSGNSGSCGPSCFDAGPFQANVSQMTASQEGGWHIIRMTIQFHNASNQPLVIAYHDGSMVMVDNDGNTYIPAGGNPGQLQGMGIDRGTQTDSQFQLGPGQTGNALFSVARGRAANSPIGTSYSYNLTIDELQLQNGALAIPVRTYNLNFPSLAPGSSAAPFASGSSVANGFVGNGSRGSYAGTTVPQGTAQAVQGQRAVGGAAPQTRIFNGRPVTTVPTQTRPAAIVNNAAMKTPVAATQTKPAGAVRPIPATTAVKPATTTPTKKATTTPTTTTR